METTADSVEGVQDVPDEEMEEQEEDYDPAWDDNDEKHQEEEEAQDPDENAETNKGNDAEDEDEDENVQTDEEDEAVEEENEKEGPKYDREKDKEVVNEIFEKSKVKLKDGTEAPMFSRGPLYYNGSWPINCHLCSVHGLQNSSRLTEHIETRIHTNLLKNMPVDEKRYKEGVYQVYSPMKPRFNNLIKIYPGEIITEITPDLHDRILRVQERYFVPRPPEGVYVKLCKSERLHIYNKQAPIIGLSYCFKTHYARSTGYYCALCEAHSAETAAYHHFVGSRHRIKYAEKHFPRLIKRILEYLSDMEDEKDKQKIVNEVIRKVYRSIEEKRGFREVHMIVRVKTHPRRCAKFCNKIVHYEDNHVLTTDEELKEMIEKCRKGENLLEPDPPTLKGVLSKAKGDAESSKHSRSRKEETIPRRRGPHLEDNENTWDRYRRMLGAALDDIDDKYADYEKIPEKHPAYEDEWKEFWYRRVRKVEKDGLNPDDYDFKTEWIPYWKEIMQKYHSASISKTKFRIKKALRLPFDKRSPSPIRKQRSMRRKRSPSPVRPSRRRRTRSRSPAYRARRRESSPAIAKTSEPPGVISVLRLLTALEDKLGSLGPKALEYLSKSLLYEKDDGNNANQLLFNQEYYVFFVTAKEKLKGQLIADLVEKPKYKAVTHVIKEMDTLIEMFDDYCKRTGRTVTAELQSDRPQASKQQTFNEDDQYEDRSQDNYNRNRQQDFDKNRSDDNRYNQFQRGGGQMDQYRGSGGFNNQYDMASSNQYNEDASTSNQYGQNRNMSSNSNQGSSSNQYSRSSQGGVWQSGTNMTFRNNANNPQGSGGGNYGNNLNQGNRGNQNFRNDRDRNLNTSTSNPDGNRSGNYNSPQLAVSGNFNTPQGDTGYNQGNYKRDGYNDSQNRNDNNQPNQGFGSGNNYNSAYSSGNGGNANPGFGGNTQGRNMAAPGVAMNKPLGNYGGYNRSNMNTRGYGGGSQYN